MWLLPLPLFFPFSGCFLPFPLQLLLPPFSSDDYDYEVVRRVPLVAASSLFIFPPFPSEQSFHRRNTKKGKGSSPLKGVAACSIYSPGHLKMAVFMISDNFMFLMVLCGSNCQQDILCIVCLADADKSHLTHNRGNSPSWEMENYIFDLLAS